MHFVGIDMVYGRIPNAIEIVGGESANGIYRVSIEKRAMLGEKLAEKLECVIYSI